MKRCFAIVVLSVFLITYLLPVATLVKADVVIGDNDDVIVNENAYILGRKLALMESIPNLLNSGATSLTISNSDDLDSYLDSLWNEITDAVEYLGSGDWVDDIPEAFRNEALENLDNYLSYTENRGNWFAQLLGDPTTTLLKTYVIGNNLPKVEYKPNYNALNAFKHLGRLNQPTPQPDPDFSFISNINYIYLYASGADPAKISFYDCRAFEYNGSHNQITAFNPIRATAYAPNGDLNTAHTTGYNGNLTLTAFQPITVNLYVDSTDNTVSAVYSNTNNYSYFWDSGSSNHTVKTWNWSYANSNSCMIQYISTPAINFQTSFIGLSTAINYIYSHFANINLYVDGSPWVLSNNVSINPSLDIDGELKIYGDDNPIIYNITTGTEIDYDMLYDTIYNAIIDALPISQQNITYYDSHDTVYSPTIINNYGSDPDGETDWIESILDYAIVPKFETALLAPIETPLTNGLSVMVTVKDTVPEEILYVLGGGFVLLLFVCVINRMIK